MIKSNEYVPILKWRAGEYKALKKLEVNIKNKLTPLIVIPPVEFDFEKQKNKKTVKKHIEPFVQRFKENWGRRAFIELHESLEAEVMRKGVLVISHIFKELRKERLQVVPVFRLDFDQDLISAIQKIIALDKNGVCFRVRLEELMSPSFNKNILETMNSLNVTVEDVDLILDLEMPESFKPYEVFSKALSLGIKKINQLNEFRSFVLTSTSLKLSEIKKPGGEFRRHEWLLYKQLSKDLLGLRQPAFGDYAIETPKFSQLDMRKMNPAAKIVYTSDDIWLIVKGTSYRDNPDQMFDLCRTVCASDYYCGKEYSSGDDRLMGTMLHLAKNGSLTTWKEVGVNHHLTKVVNQLANFHDV